MRTPTLLLVVACAAAIACATPAPEADSAARKRAVVTELFAAISAADVETLDRLYADDFEVWTPGSMRTE